MSKLILDIEQMKHLQEQGVDTSNASMWYWEIKNYVGFDNNGQPIFPKEPTCTTLKFYNYDPQREVGIRMVNTIPAFTLQDILDILPFKHEGASLTIIKEENSYVLVYEDEDGNASPVFINEQAIDSAYEMMCWCAENGIIETKKDK